MSGYTADTVARLVAQMPDCRFVLILSSESAAHLPEWHEPERLLDLAEICVVPRLGYANLPREWLEAHFPGRVDRFTFVATSILGHSSSNIRARVWPRDCRSVTSCRLPSSAISANMDCMEPMSRPEA